jgi:hypothetical protein
MFLSEPCYNVILVVENVSHDLVMNAMFTKNAEFSVNALLYHVIEGDTFILLCLQQ